MRKFPSRALIATALAALPSVALAQSFPGGSLRATNVVVFTSSGTYTPTPGVSW